MRNLMEHRASSSHGNVLPEIALLLRIDSVGAWLIDIFGIINRVLWQNVLNVKLAILYKFNFCKKNCNSFKAQLNKFNFLNIYIIFQFKVDCKIEEKGFKEY